VGEGGQMMKKYAFHEDLAAILAGSTLWVLPDGATEEDNRQWLEELRRLCPDADVRRAFYGSLRQDGRFPLPELERAMAQSPGEKHYLISTTTYDAYNVYVKPYERSMESLLRKTKSIYIVHNTAYKLFRFAGLKAMHERCHRRKTRINIYKKIVNLIFFLSENFLREKPGWKTIK
jgi:hypothetical protein